VADDPTDALYALPAEEFVAARNALAKELQDPAIKKLKKPSAVAAALNRLARIAPEDVESLIGAADRLGAAQQDAVRGRGSAPMREAAKDEREALARLVTQVRALLGSAAQVTRAAEALRAAAVDPEGRELLRAGRLTEEPEPTGFGGLPVAVAGPAAGAEDDADQASEDEAAAQEAAERERRELEAAADKAERDAERLEARAAEAEQRAAHLRAQADEAHAAATEARNRANSA
jgi:hypothetical protein